MKLGLKMGQLFQNLMEWSSLWKRIRGASEAEVGKKDRVLDALNATKAAVEESKLKFLVFQVVGGQKELLQMVANDGEWWPLRREVRQRQDVERGRGKEVRLGQ
ncbi:hypothetical protein RJT34_04294 [Clitoria ternatea]|uniref:Uncharacterized protein n=1 Tax=Clitoria ternatea TaxID=43366 RepID=A0AAN9KN79_CLITE